MIGLVELLEEFEGLPYAARVRRMIALGRAGESNDLIDAMERGEFDQRLMALMSCYGSRDGARAVRRLADSSQLLVFMALKLVALVGTEAQVLQAMDLVPHASRRKLLLTLQCQRRYTEADACISWLLARDSEIDSLVDCLPHATAATVRAHLAKVADRFLPFHWARLARIHPHIALEWLQPQATEANRPEPALAIRARAVLPFTSERLPEATLLLVRTLVRHLPLSTFSLHKLALRLPVEVADLALAQESGLPFQLEPILPRLDFDRVMALLKRAPYHAHQCVYQPRHRLAPALRDRIYIHFSRAWEDKEGCVPSQTLAALSCDLREREARRHLHLRSLAARPQQRLLYAGLLPWEEAFEVVQVAMRDPEAELRGLAQGALALAVRYHRDRLPDLLALHIARKNEQDPVRLAMLTGLAGLPPGIWKPEHLDTLQQIFRNALDAADLSDSSRGSLQQLLVKLLPFYPNWCAEQLAQIVREGGALLLSGLEDRLSDAQVRTLAPALLSVLKGMEKREGWYRVVQIATSLGRRLRVFDALVDILERLVRIRAAGWVSQDALNLIARYRRERLETLIPALIVEDPSWVTREVVYTYLHAKRQDLLTPFLGFKAYTGRFSTGKTRFILPLTDGFLRWTARQQGLFAKVLEEVTGDTGRDTPGILRTIQQLAALPAPPPTCLIALAQAGNGKKPAVRDAALWALGRLDGGQGIPTLVEALGDERSRIAIYALRGSLLAMPKPRALALLREVPMTKVTVAKEVVRLLGELKSEEAYKELLALASDQKDEGSGTDKRNLPLNLHRDVRVALLRALWGFLDREESWRALQQAAVSPDSALASHVVRVPADGLTPQAEQHLIATLALLLIHPDARVRVATLERCATLPIADREQHLFPYLLDAVASEVGDEREAGAGALLSTYTERDVSLIRETVERILPDRRALLSLIEILMQRMAQNRAGLVPTARAALSALQTDPLTSALSVQLAIHTLPSEELIALLQQMAESRALHADALEAAIRTVRLMSTLRKDLSLETLELAFATSADRYLRRFALGVLVAQSAREAGWTDALRSRLETYRQDTAPLVAEAAQFTLTP